MTKDLLTVLYAYDRWANERTLEAAAPLSMEDYARDLGSSFGGIRGTLVHIHGSARIWLERWKGQEPSPLAGEQEFPDFESLREAWWRLAGKVEAFLAGLDEQQLTQPVAYRDTKGNPWVEPLGQLLLHRVNHSSYHRGQVAGLMRQLGRRPPTTDLIAFFRQRDGRGRP